MTTISLRQPDDLHLHLRDGDEMRAVVNYSARQFSRAIIMPNLRPPIISTQQAIDYRARILEVIDAEYNFEPLMTLYLTDNTDADEIKKAKQSGVVYAVKYYPAGATTNSDSGVTDIEKTYTVLEQMQEQGMPLLLHGEVTDSNIDIFDREAVFIETILEPLRRRLPELKIVLEHITTKQAVEYVLSSNSHLAATITPQHCLLNRNALFDGGIRPHRYCLPVLKAEQHREAVINAATSGDARFFLGTDSAPHARSHKESDCGCAGIFSAANAIELYADIFEQVNALNNLEAFASEYGAVFYGLPLNENRITLQATSWNVPDSLPYAGDEIVPFAAGEQMKWKMARN